MRLVVLCGREDQIGGVVVARVTGFVVRRR